MLRPAVWRPWCSWWPNCPLPCPPPCWWYSISRPNPIGQQLLDWLAHHTELRCRLPIAGETIETGTLYLAPPDRHLLAKDGSVGHPLVTKGPRKNHYRPGADALFRSADVTYWPRVVLTGMLHDGTAGLEFIKRCGGMAMIQDQHDALSNTAARLGPVLPVMPLVPMRLAGRIQ